jgi:hypothetical protein
VTGAIPTMAVRVSVTCAVRCDLRITGEDDDGMADRTPTKIPGPEHERLRYGTVVRTPDDRPAERATAVDNAGDRWADSPPGPFDIGTPEDRPGSIGAWQLRVLQIAFKDAGIDDRDVRLGMVAEWIGRQVLTAKQLSRLEADHVIQRLQERKGQAND